MEQVFIFKTDVATREDVQKVAGVFASVTAIRQWNVDLDDCDKILRVVTTDTDFKKIERLLKQAKVQCENLAYEL